MRLIKKKSRAIDELIDEVVIAMRQKEPCTTEYDELLARLERLTKLKDEESRGRVSADTIVLVAGNLVGIGVIVGYERAHVMTSKALSFIRTLK